MTVISFRWEFQKFRIEAALDGRRVLVVHERLEQCGVALDAYRADFVLDFRAPLSRRKDPPFSRSFDS